MNTSAIDFKAHSTEATRKVATALRSTPKLLDASPKKDWAQDLALDVVEGLNRMRTDEAFRKEIAAKAK